MMNFGKAIEELKKGNKVARLGWNGKGMFLYLVVGTELPVTALRGAAYEAFDSSLRAIDDLVAIGSHIDMKTASGDIAVGWNATQADMLSEDWAVVQSAYLT